MQHCNNINIIRSFRIKRLRARDVNHAVDPYPYPAPVSAYCSIVQPSATQTLQFQELAKIAAGAMLPARVRPVYTALKTGVTRLQWESPPRNIFVAKKDFDHRPLTSAHEFIEHLHAAYPVNILSSPATAAELGLPYVKSVEDQTVLQDSVDLMVTMGGDGTILRAAALFRNQALSMPPILSFSMGTVGFLLPFDYKEAHAAFKAVYNGNALATKRSRLRVSMPRSTAALHAMNDITIHRGASPHLAQLDITVNGQHLTTAIADGVTISTPTGSTAYSLSAGGSIVHPGVECILITPICPRSLSFRPLLVPQNAHISISVSPNARGPSDISLDGYESGQLHVGDRISVEVNPEQGIWCVSQGSDTDDWARHLNGLLGFNSRFGLQG